MDVFQEMRYISTVLNTRRMGQKINHQAERINHNMTLARFDLFPHQSPMFRHFPWLLLIKYR